MKLSEIDSHPFRGTVVSQRTGITYDGVFVKLGTGGNVLVETPTAHDADPGIPIDLTQIDDTQPVKPQVLAQVHAFLGNALGTTRYIVPAVIVLILGLFDENLQPVMLPTNRLPLILDDLDVQNYQPVDVEMVTRPPASVEDAR